MIGAWWRLLRVSNLPTVWTNVLLGVMLSLPLETSLPPWWPLVLLLIAGSCAYLGGMVMNDISDLHLDRETAPDRPLVREDISLPRARAAMNALIVLSMCTFVAALWVSSRTWQPIMLWVALIVAIQFYNMVHRQSAAVAAVLMASCRGLLVLSAAAATGGISDGAGIGAAAVACWTAGITLLARGERGGESTAGGWTVLLCLAALAPLGVHAIHDDLPSGPLLGGLVLLVLIWIPAVVRHQSARRQGSAIVGAILGLCVLDAALLLAADRLVAGAAAIFAMLVCMVLQRLQPGT